MHREMIREEIRKKDKLKRSLPRQLLVHSDELKKMATNFAKWKK
jgi:hypothetical protein